MNIVWVLVCDAARARLFEIRDGAPAWQAVATFDHAESRQKSSDLAGDHLGQRSSEGSSVHHGALAPAASPQEIQKTHFGHSLATVLDQGMRARRFHRWVLVAPPHFLGMLKNELTPELQKHLLATVDKNLVHLDGLMDRLKDEVCIPTDQREHVRRPDGHAH
jgi:protein required for attachment to host cells